MVTSKLVTNVYYGSSDHLKLCLNRMVEDGQIAWWVFCCHKGEREYNTMIESWQGDRDKDHIHVGIKPNKRLNFDLVYANCLELVDGRTTGFTRNWVFVRSEMDFWLYLFHDKDYCAYKNLIREYNYKESDLVCSDEMIKCYELRDAREKFWAQAGMKDQVLKCVKGKMSELQLYSQNPRIAYAVDKMLKAARKEVFHEINKEDGYYKRFYFREAGLL